MNEPLEQVSVESNGRVLTGVGISAEDLATAMPPSDSSASAEPVSTKVSPPATPDRAQPAKTATEPASETPDEKEEREREIARNKDGTFAKQSRGARRFDQLTREREEARREAAQAREELARVQRQQQQTAPNPAPNAGTSQPPAVTESRAAAAPEQGPKFLRFNDWAAQNPGKDYGDYEDALQAHILAQAETRIEAKIRERLEADQATRGFQEHVTQVVQRGRETYSDFETVIASGPGASVVYPQPVLEAIALVPHAEHVQYLLAGNRDLAEAVAQISDPFTLGMVLAQLAPPSGERVASSPASTRRPVTSQAPAPYQPVGSGSKTTSPSLDDLANAGDFYAYQASRRRSG